jgi:hemerythrin-like domain-containing protein
MGLVMQLKKEHVEIMHSFESIKSGVSKGESGDSDLVNELRELKNILVAHLDLEDKMLYPALAGSAEEEAKKLGEEYSEEMIGISKVALAFFGKYMSEMISDLVASSEFRKELDSIIQAVMKRVDAEEKVLFPIYDKCCSQEAKEQEGGSK